MRLFLAINLPDEVRQAGHEAAAPLRAAAPGASWVAGPNLHLTVKFLGDVTDAAADALVERLGPVVARHAEMPIELAGAGAFPSVRRPRVAWLGVEASPRLELLHHDIESACETLGFPVEGRAFRPHVTLGRVKTPLAPEAARAFARAARQVRFQASAAVASVDVMRSDLSSAGARYTVRAVLPLRDA